jgi:hypothetical protein
MGRTRSRSVETMGWVTILKRRKYLILGVFVLVALVVAGRTIPVGQKQGYVYSKNYDNCAEHATLFSYSVIRGELTQYQSDSWVAAPPERPAGNNAQAGGFAYSVCGDGHLYITKKLYLLR